MPLTIKKQGGKYIVTDPAGKKFGTHDSKKDAVDQIAAIESNKSKSGLELAAADRISSLDDELAKAQDGTPPIVIVSDGTPEGTALMLNGQLVPAKRISLYCSNSKDYPHCDLSITMEESDDNGIVVEKTLTLRKEPPLD